MRGGKGEVRGGKGEEKERCKERGRHNISGQLHVTEGKR